MQCTKLMHIPCRHCRAGATSSLQDVRVCNGQVDHEVAEGTVDVAAVALHRGRVGGVHQVWLDLALPIIHIRKNVFLA